MKKILVLILLTVVTTSLWGNKTLQEAEKLYKEQKFSAALDLYKSLLQQGYTGLELFYNTANCYYKTGELGYAVAYYEKALKSDPSDEDIKANLRLVNAKLADKINEEEKGLSAWFKRLLFLIPADKWTSTGLILWVFAFLGFVALRLHWVYKKGYMKVISWSALSIGFLFLLAGFLQYRSLVKTSHVVIVAPTVSIRASPSESSRELYILHEGAKINRHKTVEDWIEVSVNNDNYGWVKKADAMEI